MAQQNRTMTQAVNKDVEGKRLPQEYFVEKGAVEKSSDLQLQERIWSFLKSVPELDLSEVEIDIADGVVTLMGTFTDEQIQGRVLHHIMRLAGVRQVNNQSHLLKKHPQKLVFDQP